MSTGAVTVWLFFRQPYCWDFLGVASLSHLEDTISSWILSLSAPSLIMSSEPEVSAGAGHPRVDALWVWGVWWCCRCTSWGWAFCGVLFSAFWPVVALFLQCSLFFFVAKRNFFDMEHMSMCMREISRGPTPAWTKTVKQPLKCLSTSGQH